MAQRSLLLLAIFSLGVLASACGSTQAADTATATSADVQETTTIAADSATDVSTATTESTTTPDSTTAPAGALVDLVGGGQLDLNSIQGTDTVLWFWAPW